MERVKAIYDHAIDLQPEERKLFLQQISSEDPELRQQVQSLLDRAQADTEELPPAPADAPAPTAYPYIFSPGDLIAGRYRVLCKVAKGGMGEVYEVADLELHSRVALKVISLKSAAKPNALEMFRREILLARQVTHPNVCRIYDIGHHDHPEHGDLLFLTMEFLQGRTLADRVRKHGPLSKEEALPLLQQMIQALAAAHRLNIAHRDFKSANVILCDAKGVSDSGRVAAAKGDSGSAANPVAPSGTASGSSLSVERVDKRTAGSDALPLAGAASTTADVKNVLVKVTDFGLARSVDGMETTLHGEVWGTPDYMAPEQFHGQSSFASDIYALGVVIYEMFTAKLPHRSSTGSRQPDGKPSTAMEMIPAEWQPVVKKCMAYEPADRYPTVDDVWNALNGGKPSLSGKPGILQVSRKTLVGVAAALLIAFSLTGWMGREVIRRWFNPLPEQKHIAVLPFESIGGDPGAKAFSDGLGETLTSKLTQLERFQKAFWVVPYSDAKKRKDVEDAYRRLNVNLVITGSMQRTKDSVEVTANLIDAKTHRQLGSRIMTASVGDLDVLQDRVWESVAEMVDLQVGPEVKEQLKRGNTNQPDAYDYYQQGVGYRARYELGNVDNAIELFQKAIAKDPKYALAYAALGEAYSAKYALTKDPQWMEPAVSNLNQSLQIDENLAVAHLGLGEVHMDRGEAEEAIAEFRRALALEPTMVRANYRIAGIYRQQHKTKEAIDEYTSLLGRRPGDWSLYTGLGMLYSEQGNFEKAAQQFQTMIDLQPDNPLGYQDLGAVYMEAGRYDEAIAVMKKGLGYKESSALLSNLSAAYMFEGKYAEAIPYVERAVQLTPHRHDLWRTLGDGYRQIPSLASKAPAAYQKALTAAQEELAVNPRSSLALRGAALYCAHLGQSREAEAYLAKAFQVAPNDGEVLFTSALVYEIIGHRKKALEALDKATKAGYSLAIIEHDPDLATLRKDPQYQAWFKQQSGPSRS